MSLKLTLLYFQVNKSYVIRKVYFKIFEILKFILQFKLPISNAGKQSVMIRFITDDLLANM